MLLKKKKKKLVGKKSNSTQPTQPQADIFWFPGVPEMETRQTSNHVKNKGWPTSKL